MAGRTVHTPQPTIASLAGTLGSTVPAYPRVRIGAAVGSVDAWSDDEVTGIFTRELKVALEA
jgi:hypothetical protein